MDANKTQTGKTLTMWETVTIGGRLIRAASPSANGCKVMFGKDCGHQACHVPKTIYEVTGKRRAPNGNRIAIRHSDGWGGSLRCGLDGSLPEGWSMASTTAQT